MCMRQERKLYFSGIFLVMHSIAPSARLLGNKYALEPIEHCRRLVPKNDFDLLKMASRPYYRHHALTTSAMAATSGSKTQQLSKVVTEHTLR